MTPLRSDVEMTAVLFTCAGQRVDIVSAFARAGATTVAELMAIGRPCILVPLPHALDNDQLENATRLQEGGGGWCIKQSELTPERLAAELERLFTAPALLADAAAEAKAMAPTDAVTKLADLVEELARSRE